MTTWDAIRDGHSQGTGRRSAWRQDRINRNQKNQTGGDGNWKTARR